MSEYSVELKGLNKVYSNLLKEDTIALKDINLQIRPGEFISIIGPSGSGKSTTSPLDSTSSSESRNLLFRIASAIGPLQVSLLLTKISLSYFFIGYTSIT